MCFDRAVGVPDPTEHPRAWFQNLGHRLGFGCSCRALGSLKTPKGPEVSSQTLILISATWHLKLPMTELLHSKTPVTPALNPWKPKAIPVEEPPLCQHGPIEGQESWKAPGKHKDSLQTRAGSGQNTTKSPICCSTRGESLNYFHSLATQKGTFLAGTFFCRSSVPRGRGNPGIPTATLPHLKGIVLPRL